MLTLIKTIAGKGRNFARGDRKRARINRLINQQELRRKSIRVRSHPYTMFLDPASMCNLKCPLCATGLGTSSIPKVLLKPEKFHRIMSHVREDLLFDVNLYNWGEPLLNPHLLDYIRYFSRQGINTHISVNFSVADYEQDFLEEMVHSGLNTVICSIDGATPESYAKYRVQGNFERVTGNMKRLAQARTRLGSESPYILYRMLINRHNEHEIEAARDLARTAGVDFLADENFYVPPDKSDEWVATRFRQNNGTTTSTIFGTKRKTIIHTECRQLWDTLLVNGDGIVMPCCITSVGEHHVGNLAENDITEIWNNEKMMQMRRYVTDPAETSLPFANACEGCTNRYCTHGL